jgi:tryptophan-rich sensory protein
MTMVLARTGGVPIDAIQRFVVVVVQIGCWKVLNCAKIKRFSIYAENWLKPYCLWLVYAVE